MNLSKYSRLRPVMHRTGEMFSFRPKGRGEFSPSMNFLHMARRIIREFADSGSRNRTAHRAGPVFIRPPRISNRPHRHAVICASLLTAALFLGAASSRAQISYTWTTGNDYWQDVNAWTPGGTPGTNDTTCFTNAATYYMTLTNSAAVASNVFANASNTTATVTLDLGTSGLATVKTGMDAFVISEVPGSTSIVYVASSTQAQGGLAATGSVVVGQYGMGSLYITNGYVICGTNSDPGMIVGENTNACGALVVSGANTYVNNLRQLTVGSGGNFGNTVVISNSASMTVLSSFRFGSSSGGGGSSNNLFLLDTGAMIYQGSSPVAIGHRSSNLSGSYNNTVIIQNGAIWNNGTHTLDVGTADTGPATGNVFTVGAGGSFTNANAINITASNTLNLAGGSVECGSMSCSGIIQGYGTLLLVKNAVVNAGGFFNPSNSVAPLTFSGSSLMFAAGSVATLPLGTNFYTTVVNGKLYLSGTLNFTDSGGLTNGTYTLFTCNSTLNTNGMTIGSTPCTNHTYSLVTTASQVNLVVAPVPVASFTGSPLNGAPPLAVTFTDTSAGTITNWYWDFGDGTTTNASTNIVSHTYNDGTYPVSLTIWAYGGTSTNTKPGYIQALNPPNLAVNPASLTYGSVTVGLTNTLSFSVINAGDLPLTGTAAAASPFVILSGGSYTVPGGQTQTVSVAFAPTASGSFSTNIIFTTNGGLSTNTVSGTGFTPASIGVNPASYDFGPLATGALAQTTFVLTNSGGTTASNGTTSVSGPFTILSGGSFSVPGLGTTNVVVQFAPVAAGGFTNNVVFTAANGGVSTSIVTGTGAIVPVASFSASPTTGPTPLTVVFADSSAGTITNRYWDFGDGATTNTTDTSLSHTYSGAGTFSVSLTVSGSLGANTQTQSGYIAAALGGGYALEFDGTQNFARSLPAFGFGQFGNGTWECWIRFTNSPPQGGIVMAQTDDWNGNGNGWYLKVDGAAQWEFDWQHGDQLVMSTAGQNLYDSNWHHLAVTCGGSVSNWTYQGWTDGQPSGELDNSIDQVSNYRSGIDLGAAWDVTTTNSPEQFSPAIIDEARVSSTNWYSASFTPSHCLGSSPYALAYYTMDSAVTASLFAGPTGVAVDTNGNIYVTDNNTIREIASSGTSWTTATIAGLAGTPGNVDGTNGAARFSGPAGVAVDSRGNLYVADAGNNAIRLVAPSGTNWVTTTLVSGINSLGGIAVDTSNNLFVTDSNDKIIREITQVGTNWVVNAIAGLSGSSGTVDGTNSAARFLGPVGIAVDANERVYVADLGASNTVRQITQAGANWVTRTIASGFQMLQAIAADNSGRVYVADADAAAVEQITQVGTNWITSTIASGFNFPSGVGVDSRDNVYEADNADATISRIAPVGTNWVTSIIAGISQAYGNGDNLSLVPDGSSSGLWLILQGNPAPSFVSGVCVRPPAAGFSASPSNGPWPLTVTFTDSSTGTVTNRYWNFGDGDTTNVAVSGILHTYTAAGTDSLTVSGPLGSSSLTQQDYIVIINPPLLMVTPGTLTYGGVTVGQTNTLSFSVANSGDLPLSATVTTAAPFTINTGGSYDLSAGQTTTVTVAFAPGAASAFTGSVVFVSNGGDSTNTVTGTGLTPGNITVTPASFDFGIMATGALAQTMFVVTNSGGTTVSNGTTSVTGPFSIVSGATFSVGAFGSTNVTVQFQPLAAGSFTNNVIFSTANGGEATNTISGTVAIPPSASFTANPLSGAAPLAVTFIDNSTGMIVNRSWTFGDGVTTNITTTSVAHTYTGVGTYTVTLVVTGPVGASTNTQPGYIAALNPPNLVVNPAGLTFGLVTVGQTNTLSFSVINTGDLSLTGTVATASPFFIGNGSPYAVPGGQTQTVSVGFAPVTGGAVSNFVVFTSNGGISTDTVGGTGLVPGNIAVIPASHNFGVLATGTLAQTTFVVTNSGGATVSNGTTSVTGPFVVLSGASFSVPGFGTTNVVVQFAPVTVGGFTNSVIFGTANGGASTNTVSGTGLTPGNIGASPATYDFGVLATGALAQTTFVVTNSGGIAVSNGTASVSGPFTVLSGASFSLPGFGTTNVVVQFAPVAAGGFTNSVIFSSANGGTASNTVAGSGAIVPLALFTANPTSGPAPLAVTFTDTSTGTITNRLWTFGDGATTNTPSASLAHTYNVPGTNSVSLTVYGPLGSSTTNRTSYIIVTIPDTTPPQLTISSPTSYQVFTNAAITVSGTASDASGIQGVTVNGAGASLFLTNWSTGVTLVSGTNAITVIATDASANMNTATQMVHAVLDTTIHTNHPPRITTGLWVTNAVLQAGTTAVVLVDDTNVFAVSANDIDGDTLQYQWVFGDGDSTNTAAGTVEHVYTNECGPYAASVTVSDGQASTNSDLDVAVACQMQITKLQVNLNFARTNSDSCTIQGAFELPANYGFTNKLVTIDVGGAEVVFTLPSKAGTVRNGQSTFTKPSYNKKTGQWKFSATLKSGFWQTDWAAYGMINSNMPSPGILVTNFPVIFVVDTEAFMQTANLHYTAKAGKTGAAK